MPELTTGATPLEIDAATAIAAEPLAEAAPGTKAGSFAFYRNGTFVALLVGYAGYYLCRQNLSAAYKPMHEALGLDKVAFGTIGSVGVLMYALGKVLTGSLADRRGGRAVFLFGLVGSIGASILFGVGTGAAFFVAVWGLNRLFQSMGWGGLVNVMARWFPPRSYGTAMGIMSINYQFGGVLAMLLAGGILAVLERNGLGLWWQAMFLVPALVLALIGLAIRPLLKGRPEDVGLSLEVEEEIEAAPEGPELTYLQNFKIVLSDRKFLFMCGLSFVLTLLRESFNLWLPAYFTDTGSEASKAVFESALFPFCGCLGTLLAGWLSDRYLEGRRGPVMGVLMVGLAFSLLGLAHTDLVCDWLCAHAFACNKSHVALGLVALNGFLLLGPYSLVGGVAALDFGGRKTAGTAAGLLDGTGYLGATLGGVGVAWIVNKGSWGQAYTIMAGLTAIGVVLCGFLWRVRPKGA
jgi:sugar phosphate permease